jgi:hypothetical protein
MKPGRNDPCACGSGRKYKHCCERKQIQRDEVRNTIGKSLFYILGSAILIFVAAAAIFALRGPEAAGDEPTRVWSAAHGHWHFRLPDGSEVEARPGMTWSAEQGNFVQAPPLVDAARKHSKSHLDQHLSDVESSLADEGSQPN